MTTITKKYEVSVEIAGSTACFTRPDSGSSFVSYPCPTFSAATAIFAAVARLNTAYIRPVKVHICRPVVYRNWKTNYGGPLRKGSSISSDSPYQLPASVLSNVVYQLFGEVVEIAPPPGRYNRLHYLQDKFNRRLKSGRLFSTPCLGWSEFTPDYFGPIRPENGPDEGVDETIPSMLWTVFDKPLNGSFAPTFRQNVRIEKGVLSYA